MTPWLRACLFALLCFGGEAGLARSVSGSSCYRPFTHDSMPVEQEERAPIVRMGRMLVLGCPLPHLLLSLLAICTGSVASCGRIHLLELFAGCRSVSRGGIAKGLQVRYMDMCIHAGHNILTNKGFVPAAQGFVFWEAQSDVVCRNT